MSDTAHIQWPRRPEEGARYRGTEVKNGYGPPCMCQELNPGLVEERPVLSITEPYL